MADRNEHLNNGLIAFKGGDFAAAVKELERATIEEPQDHQAFLYLGAAYVQAGRHNAAIGALKRAVDLKPDDARLRYNLGQAYEAAGVPREALHEYKEALRINPYHSLSDAAYKSVRSRLADQNRRRVHFAA